MWAARRLPGPLLGRQVRGPCTREGQTPLFFLPSAAPGGGDSVNGGSCPAVPCEPARPAPRWAAGRRAELPVGGMKALRCMSRVAGEDMRSPGFCPFHQYRTVSACLRARPQGQPSLCAAPRGCGISYRINHKAGSFTEHLKPYVTDTCLLRITSLRNSPNNSDLGQNTSNKAGLKSSEVFKGGTDSLVTGVQRSRAAVTVENS